MSEKKNIDRLFQEKFKDFESEPSEQAWQYIEARLEKKKKKRIIPLWFQLSGAAAVLLIGLLIAFNFDNRPAGANEPSAPVVSAPDQNAASPAGKNGKTPSMNNVEEAVVSTKNAAGTSSSSSQNPAGTVTSGSDVESVGSNASGVRRTSEGIAVYPTKEKTAKSKRNATNTDSRTGTESGGTKTPAGFESESQYAATSGRNNNKQQSKRTTSVSDKNADDLKITQKPSGANNSQIAINENNQSGKTQQHNNPGVKTEVTEKTTATTQAIAAKPADTKKDSTALAMAEEPNALGELLKEKENNSVTENEPKINRWQITSNVAPIYLSSTSEGSPIDSRFSANDKEYKTKFSYGLGLSYAVSKKFAVRTGVNTIALEYNTNDVVFNQTSNARQLEHVNMNLQGSMLNIQAKGEALASAPELGFNGNVQKFEGSINQKTGYIEVPVELAYKLLDRKFGIELVGGFSTLFLNENEVSLISSDTEMQIGQANNLNSTHFSTNFGVGFKYNFLKSLQFNVEPKFKYQINPYTESGNFTPFLFGIYTGLNYRF